MTSKSRVASGPAEWRRAALQPNCWEAKNFSFRTYHLTAMSLECCRVCATSWASCMRRSRSLSGPNAFSMRRAISGVSGGLAVQKVGQCGAPHFQNLRRLRHVEAAGFDNLRSDQIARRGRVLGFFMGIAGLLLDQHFRNCVPGQPYRQRKSAIQPMFCKTPDGSNASTGGSLTSPYNWTASPQPKHEERLAGQVAHPHKTPNTPGYWYSWYPMNR
jgi:hypothetical protein